MPQKSTKHKNGLQPSENVALEPQTGKATGWTMPKARSKTMPPESTQHKDAPRPPKEFARDAKPGKPVPVRPKARSKTMPPKSKEKKDLMESLKPALDYITMRSKSYDKSKGRATRRSRADITTEGSDVEEAADDGGSAGREAAGREDTDDGDTDDEDADEEDAVRVQTGRRGPAEMEADGGHDSGPHAGYRIHVEEEVTEAHAARAEADGRDDARGYAAGREAPTRDLSGGELVRRNTDRAGPYDARGYATGREAPVRDPSERRLGDRELVRRDPGRTHPHPGAPRRVVDESILDRMPRLEVGDDGPVAERNKGSRPESVRLERQQRLARREEWEGVRHWNARERADWQVEALARQRRGGQCRAGQGYQGQGYQGQGYDGQAHSGQVGQGRAGQNDTTTMVVRSRHDPRDDPPPAYTPYGQRDIGPNGYY